MTNFRYMAFHFLFSFLPVTLFFLHKSRTCSFTVRLPSHRARIPTRNDPAIKKIARRRHYRTKDSILSVSYYSSLRFFNIQECFKWWGGNRNGTNMCPTIGYIRMKKITAQLVQRPRKSSWFWGTSHPLLSFSHSIKMIAMVTLTFSLTCSKSNVQSSHAKKATVT